MAISWITALKLVPWGDVIEATPQVVKAAKNLLRKKDAAQELDAQQPAAVEPLAPPRSAGEQALQLIQAQDARIVQLDRKSTRLNSSHSQISYAVFCLKKKNITT